MPYKKKEDRTEAVRRHRERQKDKKARVKKVEDIEASLGHLLRLLGFEEISYEDFVEVSKDMEKDEQGVWHDRRRGKIIYPPDQVFFGLNTMIAGNHLDEQINAYASLLQDLLEYEKNYPPES
jgi:hypothetical protein